MKNKKAFGEIQFVIFIAVFIALFGILSLTFKTQIIKQNQKDTSTLGNFLSGITTGLTDQFGFIPVSSFVYLHPYLAAIYAAFFGIPLTYIIIRLIRGGG